MANWRRAAAAGIILAFLTSLPVLAHAQAFYPVRPLGPLTTQPQASSGKGWRSLRLPAYAQVVQVGESGLLISEFPDSGDGFRQRIILVNPETGRTTLIKNLPAGAEAPAAAVGGHYLAYENALLRNGAYHAVTLLNWASAQGRPLLTLPASTYSVGPIRGLTIQGHTVYWLSTILTSQGLVSRVYRADLSRGRAHVVYSVQQKSSGTLLVAMAAGPDGLWLSADTTEGGSLWLWSYRARRIIRRIPVPHAPILLYGASPGGIVFSADYSAAPLNSAGPYPVYALNPIAHDVRMLTTRSDPGGLASVSGDWVAIDGLGIQSEVLNFKTHRRLVFAMPQAIVGGGWLVVRNHGGIHWRKL